jgi:hypothetical protein
MAQEFDVSSGWKWYICLAEKLGLYLVLFLESDFNSGVIVS